MLLLRIRPQLLERRVQLVSIRLRVLQMVLAHRRLVNVRLERVVVIGHWWQRQILRERGRDEGEHIFADEIATSSTGVVMSTSTKTVHNG